jgi:signal transduction histidine kinase/DNA-binding NarL/FixJ family response regulator/HAMP domain-containing protein
MRLLDNLPIKTKLLLSFLVIIVISSLGMFISLNNLDILNKKITSIATIKFRVYFEARQMRRIGVQLTSYEKEFFLAKTEDEKTQNYLNIKIAQDELNDIFHSIRNVGKGSEFTPLLSGFSDQLKKYSDYIDHLISLINSGNIKEVFQLNRTESPRLIEKFTQSALLVYASHNEQLRQIDEETDAIYERQVKITYACIILVLFSSLLITWLITRSAGLRTSQLIKITNDIANGDFDTKTVFEGRDEIGQLAVAVSLMQDTLRTGRNEIEAQNWLETGIARINKVILNDDHLSTVATHIITEISEFVEAGVGALYLANNSDNEPLLSLAGTYACKDLPSSFRYGEGLIGQVALMHKSILLKDTPDNYMQVISGLGESSPKNICVMPIIFEKNLLGVFEVGTVEYLNAQQLEYLQQVSEVVATALEISLAQDEMKRQKEELERVNERLTELDLMKTNFLSTVSHELRTPLTSVIGFARIMQKKFETVLYPALSEHEDKKVQKAIRQVMDNTTIIVEEGQRLTTLINDVLDLAKMEAGRVDWNITELSIEDIIDRGITSTSSLLANKPIKMCKDIADNLPLCEGDHDRLIQVVINLISNAIKFTDVGKVVLKARVIGNELVVSVIDSGSGIKPEDQPLVFEKFKQVGDTMTDKPQGTGLGLPICKEIIEHLGGRLWVESEIGVGSAFMFSLPISLQKHDTGAVTQKDRVKYKPTVTTSDGDEISIIWRTTSESLEKALRSSLEPVIVGVDNAPNILVIDDNINIRQFLHQELSAVGYEVREASSGAEGLAMIVEKKPDLIVLDVKMPHLNGFEVAVRLHTNPVTLAIPVIFHTIAEDKSLSEQLGVECYLTKPVKDTDLLAAVKKFLKIPSARKKILLFIEDLDKRRTWVSLLECCGFEVSAIDNVVQGIDSATAFSPDLVITEVSLANQYNIIQQLRAELGLERTLFTLLDDGAFN